MRQFLLSALILASTAAAVGAADLDDTRDNFETAVRTYVGGKSKGGYWVSHMHGKVIKLALTGIERDTVRRASGRWRGLVDFEDTASKKKFSADVIADLSTDLYDVKSFHWLSARELAEARPAALASAKVATQARTPGPAGLLPELTMHTLAGKEAFLPECAKAKCLTVVLAPWCPHCRKSTDVLIALQDYLPAHDVDMRVIVAADSNMKVREYAKKFGPETIVDAGSKFKVGGFPDYIVSTEGGAILSEGGNGPEDEKDPATFASAIGLP